ncbi:MAG: tRNA-binding protein [Pseudomonadota bacterium]|nr:tRNA-binding protein [Pseudomonadota bacterium]
MVITDFDSFMKIDIRVGEIVRVEPYPEAKKPALKLWIDFGPELGERKSSAQITKYYSPETLVGRQIIAVVNFKPRQIGKFISEVLVLGVPDGEGDGVILVEPEAEALLGGRVH